MLNSKAELLDTAFDIVDSLTPDQLGQMALINSGRINFGERARTSTSYSTAMYTFLQSLTPAQIDLVEGVFAKRKDLRRPKPKAQTPERDT